MQHNSINDAIVAIIPLHWKHDILRVINDSIYL